MRHVNNKTFVERLLTLIENHPASHHIVFEKLAAKRLSAQQLDNFLFEMGVFCAASRSPGALVQQLRAAASIHSSFGRAADSVEKIFASEAGHGENFVQMAQLLLPEAVGWNCLVGSRSMLSQAVQRTLSVFDRRGVPSLDAALMSLGAILALEIAAHRQIIPGEVAMFVTSGFYGFQLADIPYLTEHAGECGAERQHEEMIIALFRDLSLTRTQEGRVMAGCDEFLYVLENFYDGLMPKY